MLSMRLRGKVRQVGNHFISHIAGIVLEKQYPAKLAAHLKVIRLERQAVRADQVTEVRAPADGGGLVKGEMLLLTGPEEVVKDTEAVMAGNGSGPGIQPPKVFCTDSRPPAGNRPGCPRFSAAVWTG